MSKLLAATLLAALSAWAPGALAQPFQEPYASEAQEELIIQSVPPRYAAPRHHHRHEHYGDREPVGPNGPPSVAVQMQQGYKPSPAVRMQQQRFIPESQRQPIVQQRYWRGGP